MKNTWKSHVNLHEITKKYWKGTRLENYNLGAQYFTQIFCPFQNQLNDLQIEQTQLGREVNKLCSGIFDETVQYLTKEVKSYLQIKEFIDKKNQELFPHFKLAFTPEEAFQTGKCIQYLIRMDNFGKLLHFLSKVLYALNLPKLLHARS